MGGCLSAHVELEPRQFLMRRNEGGTPACVNKRLAVVRPSVGLNYNGNSQHRWGNLIVR